MFFGKPLTKVELSDLQRLIDNSTPEMKTLDYKREFHGGTDGAKKELLYDLTSFANASGGFMIYGIEERAGVPVALDGVERSTIDGEKLRIEALLRDGVDRRIPGIEMQDVPTSENRAVLIIRIPRSWAGPHMVKLGGACKFYSRNSAGKYLMDVAELRTAFLFSETIADKMSSFRVERLSRAIANELPVKMVLGSPKAMMHLIPFSAFNPAERHGLYQPADIGEVSPFRTAAYNWRINVDGFLVNGTINGEGNANAYSQLFRSGIIEVGDSYILGDNGTIPCNRFEYDVISAVQRYLGLYQKMGIRPPVVIMLSLLKVKGYSMPKTATFFGGDPIDRDELLLPEVIVEDFAIPIEELLKPIFDAIWNAAGVEASRCYDAAGKWVGMK